MRSTWNRSAVREAVKPFSPANPRASSDRVLHGLLTAMAATSMIYWSMRCQVLTLLDLGDLQDGLESAVAFPSICADARRSAAKSFQAKVLAAASV